MNSILIPLLLLAAPPTGASKDQPKYTEASRVFECNFEGDRVDANYDGWPDEWTRRLGPGFPQYLKIGIVDDKDRQGQRTGCLRIELDGGAAVVSSPMRSISPLFSYVLKGDVKTKELVHNTVYFELSFYDKDRKLLESHVSPHVTDVPKWQEMTLGPITPAGRAARFARIRLHLRPGKESDLFGTAEFDNIWLGRLPHMTLHTEDTFNVFRRPQDVEAICEISGISEPNPLIRYELFDISHQRIHSEVRPMRYKDPQGRITWEPLTIKQADGKKNEHVRAPTGYAAVIHYRPPVPDLGFYQVRISLVGGADAQAATSNAGSPPPIRSGKKSPLESSISLVVMKEMPPLRGGEFGWTLPKGEGQLELKSLVTLLGQVGVHWVKFPVWYEADDNDRAEKLSEFAERLAVHHIELVGMLDLPPPTTRELFGQKKNRLFAATIFDEDALWQKILDPVLTRMSLKIRWWQLGADSDISFVGFPPSHLANKFQSIRRYMQRFGQDVYLGLCWNWLYEPPTATAPNWRFIAQTIDPPLTAAELKDYLQEQTKGPVETWITLTPLPKDEYGVEDRARDLVGRMLSARVQNVSGVFIPDPFDPKRGLISKDGMPTELFLPWRTTSHLTSGAKFVGSIHMPNGSHNYVFRRGDDAVMVVWSDEDTEEILYLGDDVRQIDVWGRSKQIKATPQRSPMFDKKWDRQIVKVGRLPTFLIGVNPQIAEWRMAFKFDKTQLSSVFGKRQFTSYSYKNTFSQGVGGTVALRTPKVWDVVPEEHAIKVSKGSENKEKMRVLLGPDASSGRQTIQVDFTLNVDREYRFSVYRSMDVGLGDVMIELATKLDSNGKLIVTQHFTNRSSKAVSFNCMLFVKDRRRRRIQVLDLQRGRSTSSFILDRGNELVGKTLWLRAEEIGGNRILNFHVKAER